MIAYLVALLGKLKASVTGVTEEVDKLITSDPISTVSTLAGIFDAVSAAKNKAVRGLMKDVDTTALGTLLSNPIDKPYVMVHIVELSEHKASSGNINKNAIVVAFDLLGEVSSKMKIITQHQNGTYTQSDWM